MLQVTFWMKEIQKVFDRNGALDEADSEHFKLNLMTPLKVKERPEITVKGNFVCVGTTDMRIVLRDGIIEATGTD